MENFSIMKTIKKIFTLFVAALFVMVGCSKFDEINTNPDAPTKVTSGMLATKLILNISKQSSSKWFLMNHVTNKYIAWAEFVTDQQYNRFGRSDFESIEVLVNADKMVEVAPTEELKKSYKALAHFVRAYKFFNQTIEVGDIPYSQALKGELEGIYNPEYDTQKEVFVGILNELDEANRLFAEGENFEGDPIYGGDVAQWRKLVNSFELKVLINLYKKTSDTDLKVSQRFTEIVNNRPIFESNADNWQLVHSDASGQKYPFYKEGNNYTQYPMLSTTIIDPLKRLEDYRLFYYAEPSPVKVEEGLAVEDWDAYLGVDVSDEFTSIVTIYGSGDFSKLNDRYKELVDNEPTFKLGYAQVCFIIAEAAMRGIITVNAEDYYQKGIRSAMEFVADNTPASLVYNHNRTIDDAYISTYLTNSGVAFETTLDAQIEQIITQKYISTFLQMPLNGYYEYRRTGFPVFPINPVSNMNDPSDRIPMRWMYPEDEYSYNKENLDKALDRQYAKDDVNELMWILQ